MRGTRRGLAAIIFRVIPSRVVMMRVPRETSLPVPAGGIAVENVRKVLDFYGPDHRYGWSAGMSVYGMPYYDVPGVETAEDLKDEAKARAMGEWVIS